MLLGEIQQEYQIKLKRDQEQLFKLQLDELRKEEQRDFLEGNIQIGDWGDLKDNRKAKKNIKRRK
jgi:hypothetical protein